GDLRTHDVHWSKAERGLNGDRSADADGQALRVTALFEREYLTEGAHINPRFAGDGRVVVAGWNRRTLGFLFAGDGVHTRLEFGAGFGALLQRAALIHAAVVGLNKDGISCVEQAIADFTL